jgi:hypothetical protein
VALLVCSEAADDDVIIDDDVVAGTAASAAGSVAEAPAGDRLVEPDTGFTDGS